MPLTSALLLPLLATLAAAPPPDTVPPARAAAAPAAVAVHRQSSLPIVSLRLSLQADDPPGYAGVGHLIQHLHEPLLQERAQRVGGRAAIERNTDALVYSITGPVEDLDHLVGALRAVLEPPAASETELALARQALASERLAEWETAPSHARAALRGRLFPADLPAAGTVAAAARWERTMLADAWAAMYRPERVAVVAVGDVSVRAIELAFSELPQPGRARPLRELRDTVPVAPLAAAQATQGWLAQGYEIASAEPAVVSVAARLLQERLRPQLPGGRVAGEHWWTHHGQAIALVVSAPEPALAAARRTLGGAVAAVRADVTDAEVRAAAAALRREMLFFSRTPLQMAELIGRFADREGDADAAQRFHDALERVDARAVRRLLDELADLTPARAEIPPQQLPRPS